MKRSINDLQAQEFEIERYVVLEDTSEVDIHYLFNTLQLNNNSQRTLAHFIHNTNFWKKKIELYFPCLIEMENQRYQENPYELFAEKYIYYREMAQQFKLPITIFYLLFPALKGDLEKIESANITNTERCLLYQMAAMNGHVLAFENLDQDQIGAVLVFAASDGNHRTVSLILKMYPNLPEYHLKSASGSACNKGHIHTSLVLFNKLGTPVLTHLLYCYLVRDEYNAVNDYYLYNDFDKKAIDESLSKLFSLACDFRNVAVMRSLFPHVANKDAAFKEICWKFRSQQYFHIIEEFFSLCTDVLNTANVYEYMESCAHYGRAKDLRMLFARFPKVDNFNLTRSLCIAARVGNKSVVRFLLSNQACQEIAADTKGVALFRAVGSGNCSVILILLDHFASKYGDNFSHKLVELLHQGISRDYSKQQYGNEINEMFFENKEQLGVLIALTADTILFYENGYSNNEDNSGSVKAKVLATLKEYLHPPVLIFSQTSQNDNNMNVEKVVEEVVEEEDIGMNIEFKK